jgi:hypothetical protein
VIWNQWHHGHLGVALMVAGLWLGPWLWVPGLVLAVEDYVWQHALGRPSPLKWLYLATLWNLSYARQGVRVYPVRRLNAWLDAQLGKV